MSLFSLEIYAPPSNSLQKEASAIIFQNAAHFLKLEVNRLTVQTKFAHPEDVWLFGNSPLDRKISPTFNVIGYISPSIGTNLDVARFVSRTQDQLETLFLNIYPGSTPPDDMRNRNKFLILRTV